MNLSYCRDWQSSRGQPQSRVPRAPPVILPLASEGGCQLTMMVRGLPSLLTTVTSLGGEVGTGTQTQSVSDGCPVTPEERSPQGPGFSSDVKHN